MLFTKSIRAAHTCPAVKICCSLSLTVSVFPFRSTKEGKRQQRCSARARRGPAASSAGPLLTSEPRAGPPAPGRASAASGARPAGGTGPGPAGLPGGPLRPRAPGSGGAHVRGPQACPARPRPAPVAPPRARRRERATHLYS